MTDKNGTTTTTTMWQDNHSGLRRHKLMTKELGDTITGSLRQRRTSEDYDAVVAKVKLFSPYNGWRWYVTEWDAETGLCFGLVEGFETELGYFDLTELAEVTVFGKRPRRGARPVLGAADPGRDQEAVLGDCGLVNGAHERSPITGKGDTMPDENGTEATRSDGPSTDESLFGDAADDTEAAVADEQDADEETAQEPEGVDDAGEQADGDATEASEDLKVVVSIKDGRATIGVQQPSSDPHIESFDDLGRVRADAGSLGCDREGEGQVGGRAQVSGAREARSPGQTPEPAWAG